jgi:CRP-like cAMP-binding protein
MCSTVTTSASSSSHSDLSALGDECECLPLVNRSTPLPVYGNADSAGGDGCALKTLDGTPVCDGSCSHHPARTRFVILDLSRVSGVDATAARVCFLALKGLLDRARVFVVYCGMSPCIEVLLRANGVLPPADHDQERERDRDHDSFRYCRVRRDVSMALDWCEQQLIADATQDFRSLSIECGTSLPANSPSSETALVLPQVLRAFLDCEGKRIDTDALVDELAAHFSLRVYQQHDEVFSLGDPADAWFVLLSGQVELSTPVPSCPRSTWTPIPSRAKVVDRVRPGSVFGDVDFVLRQPRVWAAVATASNILVARVERRQVHVMRPELALALHQVLLRASATTASEKLHSVAI